MLQTDNVKGEKEVKTSKEIIQVRKEFLKIPINIKRGQKCQRKYSS
jgi:hypothetical protein